MNRKALLIALACTVAMFLSACGGGGGHTTPPATPTISITTAPAAMLEINGSTPVAATVANDSTNAGVDWTCTPTGSCGSFNPAHTASGASTTYTAPSASGMVTITADATAMSSVTATAGVTVNPIASASSLTGTYTYYANGYDSGGAPISVVGSVILDGTGDITGGEQDYFDLTSPTPTIITGDPITATTGSYTVGDDGRGSITITPTTAPASTLSFTVVNNNHALIIEFDANATSSGALDLQTAPTSVPLMGNAFASYDVADGFVFGGVVTSDGTSTFTIGEGDDDFDGVPSYDFAVTGTFTPPDPAGRGTMTLVDPNYGTLAFDYFVVGPEAFRLIETDGNSGNFFLAGSMFGQGTTSGAFSAASLTGSYVFGQQGLEDLGIGFYGAAGQFTTDATSTFTAGVTDINEGDGTPVLAGALTGDTYTVDATGYGSVQLLGTTTDTLANFGAYLVDPTLNVVDPNNTAGVAGAVMLDLDVNNLGQGFVVPQTASPTFAGNYAIIKDAQYSTDGTTVQTFDLVGQVVSDGVSMVTGTVDENDIFNTGLNPSVTFSSTYTLDTTNPGRSTSTVVINGGTADNVSSYTATSSLVVDVNMDSTATAFGIVGLGTLQQQQ
jgi:hypothetical protein